MGVLLLNLTSGCGPSSDTSAPAASTNAPATNAPAH